METEADRLAILRGLGGVDVASGGRVFVAVFDNEYLGQDAGVEVEGRQPVLTCLTSEADRLVKGAVIDVCGASYRVVRHEPDGTGMSRLVLRK